MICLKPDSKAADLHIQWNSISSQSSESTKGAEAITQTETAGKGFSAEQTITLNFQLHGGTPPPFRGVSRARENREHQEDNLESEQGLFSATAHARAPFTQQRLTKEILWTLALQQPPDLRNRVMPMFVQVSLY